MSSPVDFRFLDEGLGGDKNKKRKRLDENEEAEEVMKRVQEDFKPMETEHEILPSAKRLAVGEEGSIRPAYGRPTFDGVIAGKVSGRKWKEAKTARTSSIKVSHRRSTLEQRNKLKQIDKAYKERKHELKEQIRLHKVEKRRRIEESKKRKKENELKSGMIVQKITNPKTLKKMSKKQRKLLRAVAD
ncbi:hypothetical protein O6H91_10G058500 [Diphasiastrum complanatum]|uniref:Uncharacterized protein n=1 Tax=Diphasiastrum complanatum TaxID=34168 RepID=A0ACC2CHC9_DIPCM|nr:hypothetical protein O6H91_10G058500 [Diphasiastrum complanatum]